MLHGPKLDILYFLNVQLWKLLQIHSNLFYQVFSYQSCTEVYSCVCSQHTMGIIADKQLHVIVNIPRIWLHNATANLCLDISGVVISAVYKGRSSICISCAANYDWLSGEHLLTLQWFFIIAYIRKIQIIGSTRDFIQCDKKLFTISTFLFFLTKKKEHFSDPLKEALGKWPTIVFATDCELVWRGSPSPPTPLPWLSVPGHCQALHSWTTLPFMSGTIPSPKSI